MRRTVVIGLLGVHKDQPRRGRKAWDDWRPSVAICQQEDLVVDRFELIRQQRYHKLGDQVARDMQVVSPETEVRTHDITFEDPWDFESVFAALHAFARSYEFDPANEDYLVHITTGTHVAQICLFLLTESRHLPAKLLQTSPPQSKTSGPAGTYAFIDLDLDRYGLIAARFADEASAGRDLLKSGISTRNEGFNRQVAEIEEVAVKSRAPMLLMGPTGAGKSSIAKRIYELKNQRHQLQGGFVEVNCATLRGDGAMSALFGHRKGAFTGAMEDRSGLLRTADGGLLFLDEIGELGLDEQAMLLRALEEKRFLPLGADIEVESDFQLIAGTNRDLHEDVAAGRFRDDLLARINLWTFHLPGLSERREDIEPNVHHELELFAKHHHHQVRFRPDAEKLYLDFAISERAPWPGNFRDLNASITRMATLAPGRYIDRRTVDDEIERLDRAWRSPTLPTDDREAALRALLGDPAVDAMDRFDRVQLADVVSVCRQSPSLSAAGRSLFAASRLRRKSSNDADRLRKYLARFDLSWDEIQA